MDDNLPRQADDADSGAAYSVLAKFLMAMLPLAASPELPAKPASAFALTRPAHPDPVFASKFITYLSARAFASGTVSTGGSFHWWRPDPHSLLLPVYRLRGSQIDLVESALQLTIGAPWGASLLASCRPWTSWASIYALLEWSVNMVERIRRLFPTLTREAICQLAVANEMLVFDTMIRSPLMLNVQYSGAPREYVRRIMVDVDIAEPLESQQRDAACWKSIAPEVTELANLLQIDFNVRLVDMMPESGGRHKYEYEFECPHLRAITLFSLLGWLASQFSRVPLLVATSLVEIDLHQLVPFQQQLSLVESLVAHAKQVLSAFPLPRTLYTTS
ncbi:hypothetical protein BCR44DRAFT_1503957 [Catenaria anguillulae PL171]|uniref:Uncharacterized protein n=1 Tax=Catenaria anguillulae PL171 TaxID=765915 RepID=A0A1Y2H6S8_9FUNG|nr:hypothetical protein BCR44DRAFT_1503957 [Catenaria anguillulae PL171]